MASIENRIVQMQFDNGAFERKLSETLRSLDKLNATLAEAGSRNGLQQVADSARSFSLGPVSAAVEGVSAKFLALSTVAITVLSNITNKAIDSGARIAKSLSVDQVLEGFREYELQIQSIQTILANTQADGTNLTQVSSALDELNEYSDKTIYNFAEMTRNIGTFTAAGVGLDLSVQSIKGIANLAAISGSNSQQASTAMYQLSQAISTGAVKLMDWNSVVNAGMGGEVFQKALFETGKMMGTIQGTDMGTTFEEWTAAGNTFRGSLQDGWLTADVLTTTLQGFTGELTQAQILSMGYTEAQAQEIMRLGALGVDSATKVRTLTQLIQTTKEAISSGWAQSFRTIFGDFEEATTLFTGLSDVIGGIVGSSADARNELLQGWADLGGRLYIISGIQNLFRSLSEMLAPIKEAFREIFPAKSAADLAFMSRRFADFMAQLRPSGRTVDNIKAIFKGFFSVLEIGWTVIKEGIGFIKDLFVSLSTTQGDGFLAFAAKIGDFFTELNDKLVTGGGIADFFDDLTEAVKGPIEFIKALTATVVDFFSSLSFGETGISLGGGGFFDRLKERFGGLGDLFTGDFWAPFGDALSKVSEVLDEAWDLISGWFKDLGGDLAEVYGPGDFDTVLDGINTGLLGGILAMLYKFVSGGLKLDLGNGLFGGITETLDQLTGTLSAMQAEIKADALLKIAAALTLLTLAVILLSTIDSAALTKALAAMAVGFGELVAAFALLNQVVVGPQAALKLVLLAGGLILLSGALLLMSVAVKRLSDLSWGEMTKGLIGVAGLLVMLSAVSGTLSTNSAGLIKAGLSMLVIAAAMLILATALKSFAEMSWEEMAQGLVGVAGGLLVIVGVMNLIPEAKLVAAGVGIILISTALHILAGALKSFAEMNWADMGKGLTGVAGALLAIAAATYFMPPSLPLIGAGLIIVAVALGMIADVMGDFASFSWSEIGRGLGAMAIALTILAAALLVMSGTLSGAAALILAAYAIGLLVPVLKTLGTMKIMTIVQGLIALAAAMAIVALGGILLTPAAGGLLAFGAAMVLVGAGIALFGLGILSVAKAFEILATVGGAAIGIIKDLIVVVISQLPAFMIALGEGILGLVQTVLDAAPLIVASIGVILLQVLDTIILLIPKAAETLGMLISALLQLIIDKTPEFVAAGFAILVGLLTGIRDNIGEIVTLVAEIITNFLDALSAKIPEIIDSATAFAWAVITGVAAQLVDLALYLLPKGIEFLQGLLDGIIAKAPDVWNWFVALPGTILEWIGDVASWLWQKGIDFLSGLWDGIKEKAAEVQTWFGDLPGNVLDWIGNVARTLWDKGIAFISGLWDGVKNKALSVQTWFEDLKDKVLTWVGNVSRTLWDKGIGLLNGLWDGIKNKWSDVSSWLGALDDKILNAIGSIGGILTNIGRSIMNGLWDGMKAIWDDVTGWLGGLGDRITDLKGPPEKDAVLLTENGRLIFQGLQRGMEEEWDNIANWLGSLNPADEMDKSLTSRMTDVVSGIVSQLGAIEDFVPTITPVLDLTNVRQGIMGLSDSTSYLQAATIASSGAAFDNDPLASGSGGVKFEQNIYAPKQLSTGEIYKQTRNQITMAKEELNIP